MTIMGLVLGAVFAGVVVAFVTVLVLGPVAGTTLLVVVLALVLLVYGTRIGPWHRRWGASPSEATMTMPGDDLLPSGAGQTTRAVTIGAPPSEIWPWLVQIGYGRAGWYSYDRIDNDGRPSATRIVPDLQYLQVGDRIEMVPGMGPTVRWMDPPRFLLCGGDRDTWCLGLYPNDDGTTRLVSRWRQAWERGPATAFWLMISDPGAFVMERKMLLNLKATIERAP
jgi:hypothetical protein